MSLWKMTTLLLAITVVAVAAIVAIVAIFLKKGHSYIGVQEISLALFLKCFNVEIEGETTEPSNLNYVQ